MELPNALGLLRVSGYAGDRWAIVDAATLPTLARHSWFYSENGAPRPFTLVRGPDGKQRQRRLSRLLTNAKAGEFVVHLSGDVMDCRAANLKLTRVKSEADTRRPDPVEEWLLSVGGFSGSQRPPRRQPRANQPLPERIEALIEQAQEEATYDD